MFQNFSKQKENQDNFVAHVNALNETIILVHEMSASMRAFSHGWDEEEYNHYVSLSETLNRHLADGINYEGVDGNIDDVIILDNQLRRLAAFNDYQLMLLSQSKENSQLLYDATSYILKGLDSHAVQMHRQFSVEVFLSSELYIAQESSLYKRTLFLTIFVVIVYIGIITAFSNFVSSIREALQRAINTLSALGKHEWDAPNIQNPPFLEFMYLYQSINNMKEELYEYFKVIQSKAEVEKQLLEAKMLNEQQHAQLVSVQVSALQSQMNPHFLFNVLHQIGMASLVFTPQKVMSLIEITGNILRYSLYNVKNTVTLIEELEIIRQYVLLQKQCQDREILFEMTNPSEPIASTKITPMCLQPIVENAFKHALPTVTEGPFMLKIAIKVVGDAIVCEIRDNGRVSTLKPFKTEGIGLSNIEKLLELTYKQKNLLQVVPQLTGTLIKITFPFMEQQDESIDSRR